MTNEATLIDGLRARSAAAFREAVTRYSGAMLATARAIAGPDQAEDIVQDAWVTVFRRIDQFEGRSSLTTWLQRIVTNRAISVMRRSGRELNTTDLARDPETDWFDSKGNWTAPRPQWHASSPDALLTADELQQCLDTHVARMPDGQRTLARLEELVGDAWVRPAAALDAYRSGHWQMIAPTLITLTSLADYRSADAALAGVAAESHLPELDDELREQGMQPLR